MSNLENLLAALQERHVFLTGGAGVGKSYLTNEVIAAYQKEGRGVVPLGSTGVSAVNIGGFTVHSFFVFGITGTLEELKINDKRAKKRLGELQKILKATELIIIDEISMVSVDLLDMIAYRLSAAGYLGKLLFVGDFFQLPPIQKEQKRDTLFGGELYAFESSAWGAFDPFVIELREMMRTQDSEFTDILNKVRCGVCDDEVVSYFLKLCNHEEVYKQEPTYLYGRNHEVEQTNRMKLDALASDETILFATIQTHMPIHENKLQGWIKMLPVAEQLTLKEGAPVLFTVNRWGKFVNGERGVLRKIEEEYLIVEKEDIFVRVERHDFELHDMLIAPDGTLETIALATLSQFPLRLAYAVTIHKSQGMSIDNLVCNVDHIFAPSQFYVAVSRAIDPKNLKIDLSRGDIARYLQKVISVDERVVAYYKSLPAMHLE